MIKLINSCKNDKKELEYEGLKKRRIYFDEDRQKVTFKGFTVQKAFLTKSLLLV